MKKVLTLVVMLCVIVGFINIPADAKSSSKTKTLVMYLEGEGRGVEVTCSVPYYSKWKASEKTVYGNYTEFTTSKGDTISVEIVNANDTDDAYMISKFLSKKKYKKQLFEYLCEGFRISNKEADKYFKLKKDGNGKYMLIIDLGDQYGVIRAVDSSHLMMYAMENVDETVSASLKKRIVTYAKQVVIEKKTVGIDDSDSEDNIEVELLDVKLDPDKVIFEELYTNMAWGWQKQAIYVLGDGRVYTYNYAENPGKLNDLSEESAIEYLKGTEPACILDSKYLMKLYACAVRINPEAEFTTVHEMYDYGQRTLYFYADDGTKVKCACYGDVRYIFDDDYAKMVENLWENFYQYCK